MKNRVHHARKDTTLHECIKSEGLPQILDETYEIEIEIDPDLPEPILRNFPRRSYSVQTSNAQEIVELLAYEAHEWQAREVMRVRRARAGGKLLT